MEAPLTIGLLPLREWAYVHAELLWIYDHPVEAHYHDREVREPKGNVYAWFLRKGKAQITQTNQQRLEVQTGQWIFCPPGYFHQRFSNDAHILSLHFVCQWPSGEPVMAAEQGLVFDGRDKPELETQATHLESLVRKQLPGADTLYYYRYSDFGHFLTFHTAFLEWINLWFQVHQEHGTGLTRLSPDDNRTLQALRCLNSAPLSKGFPRQALFQTTGLGEAHLNRLFHAEYGMTLRKCWEQRRLNEAKSYLETSRMPVKEIAYSLGFRSDSHFMMWFKKHTDQRPSRYRKASSLSSN